MIRPHDSDPTTPEELLCQVASILASGVLRLRSRATSAPEKKPAEAELEGLEVPAETGLSVRAG